MMLSTIASIVLMDQVSILTCGFLAHGGRQDQKADGSGRWRDRQCCS